MKKIIPLFLIALMTVSVSVFAIAEAPAQDSTDGSTSSVPVQDSTTVSESTTPTQDSTDVSTPNTNTTNNNGAPAQDSTEVSTPTVPTQDSTTVSESTTPTQDSTDVSTPDTNGGPTQDSTDVSTPETPTTPTTPVVVTTPTVIGSNGGSSGGSGGWSGGSVSSGTPISASATSTNVDGIDMTCGNLFKTYMRVGKVNNKAEVMRLQAFLNKNLGIKLAVDGKYGSKTVAAVKKFQLKYKDSVLTPWGITLPTGYVYKTTQRQVNLLVCPARDIPMPVLN